MERIAESGGPFLLRPNHGKKPPIILVPAPIVLGAHIELADEHRLLCQLMECVQIETGERAVIPACVQVAGNSIDMTATSARHFRIVKRLVAITQNESVRVVLFDDVPDEGVVTIRE